MAKDDEFQVFPGEVLRAAGFTAENRPTITLDPANVPAGLRHLIPLADQFGISDDLIREDVVEQTPRDEVLAARRAVAAHNDLFDEWLAGPESYSPTLSDEYIAFTCLRMAVE